MARWARERRFVALALALSLAAVGTWDTIVRLGLGAPVSAKVSAEELALVAELRGLAPPEASVLEPSMLDHPDFPSPVAWHAGRSVYLSLASAAHQLPPVEQNERLDRLVAIYGGADRNEALAALAGTGAAWLYAPARRPLRFDPGDRLEPVRRSVAGTLYRVH
jgi:hypothetical protein